MASENSMMTIKIGLDDEIHRMQVDMETFTLSKLNELFQETFDLRSLFRIEYLDDENDHVVVSTQDELNEACRVLLTLSGKSTLSFTAKRVQPSLKDRVKPMMTAVEELADSVSIAASEIVAKTQSTEWSKNCTRHVAQTNRVIRQKALETQAYLARHGRRMSESEFVQKMKEFAQDVRQSLYDLLKKEEEETSVEFDAVKEQSECEETEDEEEERKYEIEFVAIRTIFPEVAYEQCETLLDQHEGDIQAVVNALIDL